MLYIPWMVILCGHNIKKTSFENFDFSAAQGEKLQKQVVGRPIHSCKLLLVETVISRLWLEFRPALSKAAGCTKRPSVS